MIATPFPRPPISARRALVDISAEALEGGAISILADSGFIVVGSAAHPHNDACTARLIIAGDSLPAECDHEWRLVRLIFTTESHGQQRIHRISEIRLVDKAVDQIAA